MTKRGGADQRRPTPQRAAPPGQAAVRMAADTWIARRRRWVILTLVLASVAARGLYFAQLNASPLIALHRASETDMHYFDGWARALAGGDWLSASVGPPMHQWHREVASAAFAAHPDVRAELESQAARDGRGETAEGLLWSRWTGGHQFYQDPLHAYLAGLTYALAGPDPRFVFAWQLALGVLANVLIFLIAERCFGAAAGAVAGSLALLCGPLMYYELLLLRDSTIACAGVGVVWLTDRAVARERWIWFGLLGLVLGLGVALKSSFALLAVLIGLGLLARDRRRWREAGAWAGAMAAGLAMALAPMAARNVALGVPPLALAGSGPLTFAVGNDLTSPSTRGFEPDPARLAAILSESGGGALPTAAATLRPHTAGSLAAVLWHKFDMMWHWYEIPNNDNFYYMRLHAPLLAWLPVTFYALGPLALVGLVLAASRAKEVWPLYLLVLCWVASLALFVVLGRLRIALTAALIPFAALTLVTLVRAGWSRRIPIAAAVGLLLIWTGRPLPDRYPLIGLTDWLTPFAVEYQDRIGQALDANDAGRAADAYLDFLRYEPRFLKAAGADGEPPGAAEREVAETFAKVHAACAGLLRLAGRGEQSRAESEMAEKLAAWAARH